jgi:site-specific DNA-methyltransferase (adenine-specific)
MIDLRCGDCLEVIGTIPDNSIDSVVTDPPYGLSKHTEQDARDCLSAWLRGDPYLTRKKGSMR